MSETRIVICHRRWIWVGKVSREENEVVIRRAMNIRQWGTAKGLGELVKGPTRNTKLDDVGVVRLHPLQVIATIDVDATSWEKHLGPP